MADAPKSADAANVWLREPAKVIGWLIAAVIAGAGIVAELATELTDLVPESWRPTVRAIAIGAPTVVLIASRIQAVLTRNGALTERGFGSVGPADFRGVWAPANVQSYLSVEPADAFHAGSPSAPTPPPADPEA